MSETYFELTKLITYNPLTGAIVPKDMDTIKVNHYGPYECIRFKNKNHLVHRLIWVYTYGKLPAYHVDHIDGNGRNNTLANLREATASENAQNIKKAYSNNMTKLLGVSLKKGRYQARIMLNGKPIHIGTYDCPIEAHQAYLTKKREVHIACTI